MSGQRGTFLVSFSNRTNLKFSFFFFFSCHNLPFLFCLFVCLFSEHFEGFLRQAPSFRHTKKKKGKERKGKAEEVPSFFQNV